MPRRVVGGVLAVALLFLMLHLQGDNNLEPAAGARVSTQQSPQLIGGFDYQQESVRSREPSEGSRRCTSMDGYTVSDFSPSAHRLFQLSQRCLSEPASRRLDGEIYCAVHHIMDLNGLDNHNLWEARNSGDVLVRHHGSAIGWIEAPPFTAELKYAESLLPDRVSTILKDPRRVCAAALWARALSNAPPPYVSGLLDACQG